jgi:hypothetical protein
MARLFPTSSRQRGWFASMPLTILQSMRYRIRGKFNPLKQFKRNNWHRHIQFEIRRLAAKRKRRVAADESAAPLR